MGSPSLWWPARGQNRPRAGSSCAGPAPRNETAPPGSAAYRPDPTGPARHLLHRIYYAQRRYQHDHGTPARSLADLGLGELTLPESAGSLKLESAGGMYEASVRLPDGRRCVLRQDSRTTVEK